MSVCQIQQGFPQQRCNSANSAIENERNQQLPPSSVYQSQHHTVCYSCYLLDLWAILGISLWYALVHLHVVGCVPLSLALIAMDMVSTWQTGVRYGESSKWLETTGGITTPQK